jgi:hypothetical protein
MMVYLGAKIVNYLVKTSLLATILYLSTPNLKIQWLVYVFPGSRMTEGQCALFGLSG